MQGKGRNAKNPFSMESRWNRTVKSLPHTALKSLGKVKIDPIKFQGTVAELLPKLDQEAKRGAEAEALVKGSQTKLWLALASPFLFFFLHIFLTASVSAYPKNVAPLFFFFCTVVFFVWAFKNGIDVRRSARGAGPSAELNATRKVLEVLPFDALCDIQVESCFPQIEPPENSVTTKTSKTSETTVFCKDIITIQAEVPELGLLRALVQRRTKKVATTEKLRINRGKDERGLALAMIAPKPKYREYVSLKLTHGRAFQLALKDSPQFAPALASLDSSLYKVERKDGELKINRVYDEPELKENPVMISATECALAIEKLRASTSS